MSLPASGAVWWQPHAFALHMFTSQRRRAGRRSRGASALSWGAGGESGGGTGETVPLSPGRAHGSLFTACLPLLPSQAAGVFWLFFFCCFLGKRGSARAFRPAACSSDPYCRQRSTRQKPHRGAGGGRGANRCHLPGVDLNQPSKGLPARNAQRARPGTMRRSRGESQLAHVFSFFLLLIRGNTFIRLPRHFPPARFTSCENCQGWKAPGELGGLGRAGLWQPFASKAAVQT